MPTDQPSDGPADLGLLSTQQYESLLRLVEPFEHACRRAEGGDPVDLAAFLPPPGDPLYRAALLELVKVDLEHRWRHGRPTRLEDYLARLPALGPAEGLPAGLVYEEFVVRRRFGDRPGLDEYRRRFPGQFEDVLRLAETLSLDGRSRPGPPGSLPAEPLAGRYELLGELGRGGMGVVYKARQLGLNRLVALKMILDGAHADADQRLRLLREAEVAARLKHPGVVQVYEVGSHGGQAFLAMEYVDGPTLAAYCGGVPQDPRWAAGVLEAVARAVHHAHERGVVHRDLKPGNVMLEGGVTPRVMDFGLARPVDAGGHTQTGAVLGTPGFMAPEQARGDLKAVGPAADVWALGAVLYDLLTGRPPFLAATAFDTLSAVVGDEPVPPRRLQPGVPRDLETVCLKCLNKEPHRRYSSAQALADDLRNFLDGRAVAARPAGAVERGWRWCARNPVVAVLLASVALAVLLGTAAATGLLVYAGGRDVAAATEGVLRRQAEAAQAVAEAEGRKAREQEALKRRALAQAQLLRVAAEYERDPGLALALLYDVDAWPASLRNVAWRLYERQCSRWEVGALSGHTAPVLSVAFSPDGLTLAGGSPDKTVRLWDLGTGQARATLAGDAPVVAVAFGPDGDTLAGGCWDGTVRLWDVKTGQAKGTLRGHKGRVWSVAFSPDGLTLASGSGGGDAQGKPIPGEVRLWDSRTGQHRTTLKGHTEAVTSVAFSPDGLTLASASEEETVRLWDARTGEPRPPLPGQTSGVFSLAFSPDGLTLAGACPKDRVVRLWDVRTGQVRATLAGPVSSVAFSPDGLTLAGGARDGTVRLWDAETGRHKTTLSGHTGGVHSVAFAPDGFTLASGSSDNTVRLWDTRTGPAALPGHTGAVEALAFAPDGLTLASGSLDQTVRLWDVGTGRPRAALPHGGWVRSVAFSPDGLTLASGSGGFDAGEVRLWHAETGRLISALPGHDGVVESVAFSPDGLTLASFGRPLARGREARGEVRLWDVKAGGLISAVAGPAGEGLRLAFGPGGLTAASTSGERVLLWDAEAGRLRATLAGHTRTVECVAFGPDGLTLASASDDNTVRLWDALTGRAAVTLQTGPARPIVFGAGEETMGRSMAFSPDGLAVGVGLMGGAVRLWDATTGQALGTLSGHADEVTAVAFSPDGSLLASGSGKGEVLLWDARTGPTRAIFPVPSGDLTTVAFSPDGRAVFARDGRGDVRAWTAADGRPAGTVDPPPGPAFGASATSPDGSQRADVRGYGVVLVDVAGERRDREARLALEPCTRASWRRSQAERAERDRSWFAAAFHLGRLLDDDPADPGLRRRLDAAREREKPPAPMQPLPRP